MVDEGIHQAAEGNHHEHELAVGRRLGHPHQHRIAARGADQRHDALYQRETQRQDEGELTEFGDHCTAACLAPAPAPAAI